MKCDENCFECIYDDCILGAAGRSNAKRDKKKSKEYYESHKEYFRQKNKEWWTAHPEKVKEHYEKHKEYYLQKRKEWYQANKEKAKTYSQEYYEKHKEYFRQKNKEWREANPEKAKEYYQRRKEKNCRLCYKTRRNPSTGGLL